MPTQGNVGRTNDGSRLIARDSFLNLLSAVLPLLAALVAIPITIREYGLDRYGVILICQVVLGYFAFVDFGLGKATSRFLSEAITMRDSVRISQILWFSVAASLVFGGVVGVAIAMLAPLLAQGVFHVTTGLREETTLAFFFVAFAAPFGAMGNVVFGAIDASKRFGLSNLVQLPSQVMAHLLPIVLLPLGHDSSKVVLGFGVMRALTCVGGLACAIQTLGASWLPARRGGGSAACLFKYSLWLSVSSLASPLLAWLDRFILGSKLSVAAVATYSVPSNLVSRLLLIPASMWRALFPRMSAAGAANSWSVTLRWTRYQLVILVPAGMAIILAGPWFMRTWLGNAVGGDLGPVLQILVLGGIFNSAAYGPLTYLQATGRPDIPARWHALELVLYVPILLLAVARAGVVGAAITWTARVTLDCILLMASARSVGPASNNGEIWRVFLLLLVGCALLPLSNLLDTVAGSGVARVVLSVVMMGGCALLSWFVGLAASERSSFARIRSDPVLATDQVIGER